MKYFITFVVALMASFSYAQRIPHVNLDTIHVDFDDIDDLDDIDDEDDIDLSPPDTSIVDGGFFGFVYEPDLDVEYKVTSVAGIRFGMDKYSAHFMLKNRFGYHYKEDGNIITYYNITIGSIEYEFADFYFSNKGLCSVRLSKHFALSQFEKAKQMRDDIAYCYGLKYKNIKSRVDQKTKIKYYVCGMVENHAYPIIINLEKSTSKGGDSFYYVIVEYFSKDDSIKDDI